MSQEQIKAHFVQASGLNKADAEDALTVIARQLYALIPAGMPVTEAREWLLDFLTLLANGDASAISKVSGKLPYESGLAAKYVRLVARAWLDQAGIDRQRGLSQASSVHVEIGKFARGGSLQPGSGRVMNDPGAVGQQQQQPASVPEQQANEYRVWFGTNREYAGGRFTAERGKNVSYGFCDVYVPKSHKIGSLGSSFLTRLVTMTDDRLKLRRVCTLPQDGLWQLIKAQLASVDESERHAVVFIHGYNVSFADAALRSAQIGFDLGVAGAMAFFSWPSKGTVKDYVADGASIEASEVAIADFLVSFAEEFQATAVHVIAHSMGNRGVLRAVTRIAANAQRRTAVPFANFILAAPDVDAETFRNLAEAYGQLSYRTTLYVSERDRAVGLAAFIHDYPRVGFTPPVSVFAGIDTVSVSSVDLTMLGHGYIGEAREVLTDMHSLIFQGLPPEKRFSLDPAFWGGELYWEVRG
jgi:esterase/lipase superfamily enzyme